MKTTILFLFAIAALGAVGVTTAIMSSATTAHAAPNPVSGGAKTNGGYQTNCKESSTAKECATGPGNNGEFTSDLAHNTNKP